MTNSEVTSCDHVRVPGEAQLAAEAGPLGAGPDADGGRGLVLEQQRAVVVVLSGHDDGGVERGRRRRGFQREIQGLQEGEVRI